MRAILLRKLVHGSRIICTKKAIKVSQKISKTNPMMMFNLRAVILITILYITFQVICKDSSDFEDVLCGVLIQEFVLLLFAYKPQK